MPTINVDICRTCGKPASAHHVFEPEKMPIGCVCHPYDWPCRFDTPVLSVCERFAGHRAEPCGVCEHAVECHAVAERKSA